VQTAVIAIEQYRRARTHVPPLSAVLVRLELLLAIGRSDATDGFLRRLRLMCEP
jgi:hypothetical protein